MIGVERKNGAHGRDWIGFYNSSRLFDLFMKAYIKEPSRRQPDPKSCSLISLLLSGYFLILTNR